jgi:hypothetical protein
MTEGKQTRITKGSYAPQRTGSASPLLERRPSVEIIAGKKGNHGEEAAPSSFYGVRRKSMSTATMLQDYRSDKSIANEIETRHLHGWRYTYLHTSRGVRVAVTDPRGKFAGYYPLPRKRSRPSA